LSKEVRELVRRSLAGDETARAALVVRYQGQVFSLCYRMLRHRQDAEDAAQETFVRAFRSLRSYDSKREFEPWLLAIAGNRCRSQLSLRVRAPRPQALHDELADEREIHDAGTGLAEEVGRAIDKLRADYRAAFVLFHQQHFSYAEISETLECPVGTAKTWVHRARREVARLLVERGVVEEMKHELQ